MPFLDEQVIQIQAGDGGAGCLSFRRERHLPRGGPDGGDGGKGGDVYLVASDNRNTLDELGGARHFRASNGQQGTSRKCHGRSGDDLTLELPRGTIVRDAERGHVLCEVVDPSQPVLFLKGGKGGKGNHSFRSAVKRTPRQTQPGEPGERRRVQLELKILAHVGLVGLPNAGKSTLLSKVSGASPKVGNYPFTTLQPRIGVVEHDYEVLTIADMPGLLEGAHAGRGLGDRFLRHIERTRVLAHLVDVSEGEPSDWVDRWRTVRDELAAYGNQLAGKPELLVLTKVDVCEVEHPLERFRELVDSVDGLEISAEDGVGLDRLIVRLFELAEAL